MDADDCASTVRLALQKIGTRLPRVSCQLPQIQPSQPLLALLKPSHVAHGSSHTNFEPGATLSVCAGTAAGRPNPRLIADTFIQDTKSHARIARHR